MGQLVLPDTNLLILGLAGQEPYASYFRKQIEEKNLVFSAVVVAVFLSKATDEEEKIVSELFARFQILPVDLAVAQLAAYYRKTYAKKKHNLKLPDCFIAATAKIYKLTLATLDKAGYPMRDIDVLEKF